MTACMSSSYFSNLEPNSSLARNNPLSWFSDYWMSFNCTWILSCVIRKFLHSCFSLVIFSSCFSRCSDSFFTYSYNISILFLLASIKSGDSIRRGIDICDKRSAPLLSELSSSTMRRPIWFKSERGSKFYIYKLLNGGFKCYRMT
jgi:hypothetical protein